MKLSLGTFFQSFTFAPGFGEFFLNPMNTRRCFFEFSKRRGFTDLWLSRSSKRMNAVEESLKGKRQLRILIIKNKNKNIESLRFQSSENE